MARGASLEHLTDVEALSFDCYGTLIDWETGLLARLRPWAQAAGRAVGDEELLGLYAEAEADAERRMPSEPYPRVVAASMRAIGERLGVPVSEADADRLGASVPDWPAFPDSPQALAALAERYRLIILSNVDRASFAGSEARLGVRFDAVLTAEDIGSYKPAAANFAALLDRARELGVAEGRLLHVAQSLFHDHIPAQRAGLRTVWIDRRHGRRGPGATPPPGEAVTPDWTFPSLAAFAAAACGAAPSPPAP